MEPRRGVAKDERMFLIKGRVGVVKEVPGVIARRIGVEVKAGLGILMARLGEMAGRVGVVNVGRGMAIRDDDAIGVVTTGDTKAVSTETGARSGTGKARVLAAVEKISAWDCGFSGSSIGISAFTTKHSPALS